MELQSVTDATFATDVLAAPGVVLVDFWAPWCAPCKIQHPILEELARETADAVVVSLNVDENPVTAGKYQIMSIPTLLIFRAGAPVAQLIGLQRKEALRAKLADLRGGSGG